MVEINTSYKLLNTYYPFILDENIKYNPHPVNNGLYYSPNDYLSSFSKQGRMIFNLQLGIYELPSPHYYEARLIGDEMLLTGSDVEIDNYFTGNQNASWFGYGANAVTVQIFKKNYPTSPVYAGSLEGGFPGRINGPTGTINTNDDKLIYQLAGYGNPNYDELRTSEFIAVNNWLFTPYMWGVRCSYDEYVGQFSTLALNERFYAT